MLLHKMIIFLDRGGGKIVNCLTLSKIYSSVTDNLNAVNANICGHFVIIKYFFLCI